VLILGQQSDSNTTLVRTKNTLARDTKFLSDSNNSDTAPTCLLF
jgi:hypothetical protein